MAFIYAVRFHPVERLKSRVGLKLKMHFNSKENTGRGRFHIW